MPHPEEAAVYQLRATVVENEGHTALVLFPIGKDPDVGDTIRSGTYGDMSLSTGYIVGRKVDQDGHPWLYIQWGAQAPIWHRWRYGR